MNRLPCPGNARLYQIISAWHKGSSITDLYCTHIRNLDSGPLTNCIPQHTSVPVEQLFVLIYRLAGDVDAELAENCDIDLRQYHAGVSL